MLFGPGTERRPRAAECDSAESRPVNEDVAPSLGGPDPASSEKPKRKGHGRAPASRFTGARRVQCADSTLSPGRPCPECFGRGRLYDTNEPSVFLQFTGQPVVAATVFERQVTRCSFCTQRQQAPLPDGVEQTKWDATADVAIAVMKYCAGMPWYRLAHLEAAFGIPIAASTLWERCEHVGDCLLPVFLLLEKKAAEAELFTVDDTSVRILDLMRENTSLAPGERRGMFTTGLLATVEGRRIALYSSGRHHAGENLAKILKRRPEAAGAPITMADALARNWPPGFTLIVAKCLVHGRRQFVEIETSFPGECKRVLDDLAFVFRVEAKTTAMSPEERLAFHQQHSAPVMDALEVWIEEQLEQTEPNAPLGAALRYMRRHWSGLSQFLRTAGCPLDSNAVERALRRAVLNRKNAMFFRTQHGADISDVIMSVAESARLAQTNLWEYLVDVVRNRDAVRAQPAAWLPWAWAERHRAPARAA